MITREELTARIMAMQADLRAQGVSHMALFGSRARGDAREDSDVDLMIDIDHPRFTILDLIGIEHDLADRLGLPVQLTLRRGMTERFAKRVEDDLIELF
jgi:predicted nucleotidyltransferase